MNGPAVGCHKPDPFAAVMGTSSAKGDDHVTSAFLIKCQTLFYILVSGIGHRIIVDHGVYSHICFDQIADLSGNPCRCNSLICDNKRFIYPKAFHLRADLFVGTNAHEGNCGNVKSVNCFSV